MDYKKIILLRSRIIFLFIVLFSFTIIFKAAYIQIIDGQKWRKLSAALTLEYKPIKATRGNIYSKDNLLLATSLPFYKVILDPFIIDEETFKNNITELAKKLSQHFKDKTPNEYEQIITLARKNKRRYLKLNSKSINHNEKKEMMEWPIFNKGKYKGGVIFEKEEKRYQPLKSLASRTIGHINKNKKGSGLEYTYNDLLKGKDGEALYQKTSGGWKLMKASSELKPIHGYDIETTLDVHVQDIAEDSLKNALIENDADYGCAIIMEVKTAEILAIVNLTKIKEGHYAETFNYAIGLPCDPGSTFKIPTIMALFEETDLKLEDVIDTGNGKHKFFNETMYDHKKGGFGLLTVQQVIEFSSMIGIAKLTENGFGHNPQRYIEYLNKMGFTSTLGFHILGEAQPVVKTPKQKTWSGITLPWMSTGYEIEVTPLQILTFYNAIANNGKMVKPIILKKIKDANTIIKVNEAETINRKICSIETLEKIKILLEGVVERGSARGSRKGIYQIAGKSGTAQRIEKRKYTKSYYVSFAGYFPAKTPKYSIIVGINNPKKAKQYGGDLAAPIVRQIADKIAIKDQDLQLSQTEELFKNTADDKSFPIIKGGLKKDLEYLLKNLNLNFKKNTVCKKWIRTKLDETKSLEFIPNFENGKKQVPNIIGFTLKDAIFMLESLGIEIKILGHGNRVKEQSILPGTKIDKFASISLKV